MESQEQFLKYAKIKNYPQIGKRIELIANIESVTDIFIKSFSDSILKAIKIT